MAGFPVQLKEELMIQISIDSELKKAAPHLTLGLVQAPVQVTKHDDVLWEKINPCINQITTELSLETLTEVPEIKALRDAYRAIGKDPSRYRGSQEALFRRILQGKGLYKINTIVDINNFVSLQSRHSVGSYDVERLSPPVIFRIGKSGEQYKGIGKEMINIEGLPVFTDTNGPFGSPTSDSERAMIQLDTKQVLMVIIAFADDPRLSTHLELIGDFFETFAKSQKAQVEKATI